MLLCSSAAGWINLSSYLIYPACQQKGNSLNNGGKRKPFLANLCLNLIVGGHRTPYSDIEPDS